jgi:hypothetical protein
MSKSRPKGFEKWFPHLYPKVKKIVAVKLEDGVTIPVDGDAELRGYLKCLDDERATAALGIPIHEARARHRAWVSLQASALASKPRKSVTKADLISFRGDFGMNHNGATRGWKRAACSHFHITTKTLKDRMEE